MKWDHCITQFEVMRVLKIGHSDYAYLDYVHHTERSELADDGWCCETDTDIGRRIVLSKSAVGRMRAKMIGRGLLTTREDGAIRTTEVWQKARRGTSSETLQQAKRSSESQKVVIATSSETLQESSETRQPSSETLQDTYISKGIVKETKSKAGLGRREDHFDVEQIDELDWRTAEATPAKEKSSAKKESGQPAPREVPVRSIAEVARIRAERDAAAGSPATLDDTEVTRKHFRRQHVAYLTETAEGRADWADIRAEVGAGAQELLRPHAAVKYLAMNRNVSIRKVASRTSFINSLGGAARTQLHIDRTAAKNQHHARSQQNLRQDRAAQNTDIVSDEACYEAAESYLRKRMEREAAGWG